MNDPTLPPIASPQPFIDTSGAKITAPVLPSPGTLEQPAAAPPTPGLGQAYAGGTPLGSLTSSPTQVAADQLNSAERSKGIEGEIGDVNAAQGDAIAVASAAKAAESAKLSADQQAATTASMAQMNQEHAQRQTAYDAYKAKAGSLKDPETQFYEDRGTGYRVQTALASFAAGIGAGFNGQQNPVTELLQKKIAANYEAHKQNIDDLYRSSVEAGKIEDTSENHAKFQQDALRTSAEFQSMHFKDELKSIEARSTSPLAKLAARKTIEDIDKGEIDTRARLAAQQGAAAAAQAAAQRAEQKEVRDSFQNAYDKSIAAGDAPEDARIAAAQFVHGKGYNRSATASIFEHNDVRTDPATGEPLFPVKAQETPQAAGPTVNERGEIEVPTKDVNGKRKKQDDIDREQAAAQKRALVVNGKTVGFAPTEEAAKAHNEGASNTKALDSFNLEDVTKGSSFGSLLAHAPPSLVPGAAEARKNVSARESYNDQVRVSIGAAYKSGTGANEPKNLELIKTYAEPFEIKSTDDAKSAEIKRENLKRFIRQNTGLEEPKKAPTTDELAAQFAKKGGA